MDLLHGIPFGFSFFWYFCDISFQPFKLLCLAKNHWWRFCNRNAHMVHTVTEIRFKMVYAFWSLFTPYFNHFTHLVSVTFESINIFHVKFIEIVIFGVYSPSLLTSVYLGTFVISLFNFLATLFGYGSLMMVQYSKCAYGPFY